MLKISTITAALVLFVFIVRSLRRKSLKERYVGIWIPVGTLAVAISLFPRTIQEASNFLGFQVASNLVLFLAVLFLVFIVLQMSVAISRLESKLERAIIELALLKQRMEADPPSDSDDGSS